MTLWLCLMIMPAAIGAWAGSWRSCLVLASAYVLLFSLNTFLASVGAMDLGAIAITIGRADIMILAVAFASCGVTLGLRAPER